MKEYMLLIGENKILNSLLSLTKGCCNIENHQLYKLFPSLEKVIICHFCSLIRVPPIQIKSFSYSNQCMKRDLYMCIHIFCQCELETKLLLHCLASWILFHNYVGKASITTRIDTISLESWAG